MTSKRLTDRIFAHFPNKKTNEHWTEVERTLQEVNIMCENIRKRGDLKRKLEYTSGFKKNHNWQQAGSGLMKERRLAENGQENTGQKETQITKQLI